MASIQHEMNDMKVKANQMNNQMKELLGTIHSNVKSRLYVTEHNICKQVALRFDEVNNRLKYHEAMLKNWKWEFPAILSEDKDSRTRTKVLIKMGNISFIRPNYLPVE